MKIGLGAKLVNAKESISKIETFRYDKNFYKLSISFTDSCSTTVVPDSPPPTPSAYVLYICGGNLWSLEYNCPFLEGDGGCPYTQTGPFIDWDWVSSLFRKLRLIPKYHLSSSYVVYLSFCDVRMATGQPWAALIKRRRG